MVSTRQGIISTFIGTFISLFNAVIQLLSIYFILDKFGTEFNGYIKLVTGFSALLATADGSLGLATTILLIKPIANNDWISANEIYSTSRKNYKKGAIVWLILLPIISLLYPLYAGIGGTDGLFSVDAWKHIGIGLTGSNGLEYPTAGYWTLFGVTLLLSFKNFSTALWFGVYENIIAADNKNSVRRLLILLTDAIVYGSMFAMLNVSTIHPLLPFVGIILYSPIKGLMAYIYVKRKYPWLKFYRDFNSYKLAATSKKISFSSIGTSLLLNTDVLITALILGLNVSSNLSLYLVIGVNVRIIMTNFITSFREFFVTLITQKGRIYWKSYAKYELYTYLVAGFTFINIAILAPYFVSSMYGQLAFNSLNNSTPTESSSAFEIQSSRTVLEFIFYSFKFSILYGAATSLAILCEAEMTLIQAKGSYGEVTKFQNWLGSIYLVAAIVLCTIFKATKIGGIYYLQYAIYGFYILKIVALVIRYIYLWSYVWRYVTYNSSLKHVLNNLTILIMPVVFVPLLTALVLQDIYNVEKMTNIVNGGNATISPLIGIFFGTIFISIVLMILFSLLVSPRMVWGIIVNLPVINKLITTKRYRDRQKRLEDNEISLDDIVDNSGQLSQALVGISDIQVIEDFVEDKTPDKYIYKIKY